MKVIVGITGASGSIYAIRLVQMLKANDIDVEVISTDMGKKLIEYEGPDLSLGELDIDYEDNMFAPPASGSSKFDAMVVVPSSMKTVSSISNGYSNTLVTRTADVALKENRELIIVPRETPLNSIHLENMTKLSKMGATILPASPGFYHNPKSVIDIVDHIVGKIMDTLGVEHEIFNRWKGKSTEEEKGKEIELKVPVDIENAKNKIKENGGNFRKKVNQKDIYFKTSNEEKEILRVRKSDGKTILGHKFIKTSDNSVFEESEVEVLSFNKIISILNSLGFEEKITIEKERWYYDFKDVTLELNDVRNLGGYLDFEVISENEEEAKEKIFNAMSILGYSKDEVEPRLYYELLKGK